MLRVSALLACGVLAGCAGAPPALLVGRDQVRDFALEARFVLRVSQPGGPPESSGGRLAWEHKNDKDRILISNPLGVGMAEIDVSPALSRLRTADGQVRESADADALMEDVTGHRLPVSRLPGWLLGRAGTPSIVVRDNAGRPARLSEDGWQIDYAYPDDMAGALPVGVNLTRSSEIDLRLRIEEWRAIP